MICIFGKTWDLHVHEVLRTTLDENLRMIGASSAYLKAHTDEFIYDAEHFFDGYKANPDYALLSLKIAAENGADALVSPCETPLASNRLTAASISAMLATLRLR